MPELDPYGIACPSESEWVSFAAGAETRHHYDVLLAHAAHCATCAPALRDAAELFVEAPEPRLHPRTVQAQPSYVSSGEEKEPVEKFRGRKLLLWAAAMIAAGLVVPAFFGWKSLTSPPFQELADAYTSQRSLELRFPGARYAVVSTERGTRSEARIPTELLYGQLKILSHKRSGNFGGEWLHAEGIAELLEWKYQEAIETLGLASKSGVSSTNLLIDSASAYFERAEVQKNSQDLNTSLALLSKALTAEPRNATALFNRAIVHSKLGSTGSAIEDFEAYLRIDSSGQWADEARSRLGELRSRGSHLFGNDSQGKA